MQVENEMDTMLARRMSFLSAPEQALAPQLAHGRVGDVRKIAVLRANAIGDFVFSLPALEALRAAYPSAEIVLLGLDWHAGFLSGRPSPVDRVEIVPGMQGIRDDEEEDPSRVEAFFVRMQAEKFDLALQMHGGGRYSNPFVQRLGARVTAGCRTPDAAPLDRWMPYIYFQPEVLRYLELVSLVGAAPVVLEPRLAVTGSDREEADQALPAASQPLVVLHPGAGDERRRWPPQKFAAVANALAWAGAQVAVIGTGDERELVEKVIQAMRWPAANLCDRLSLGGLLGLLSRAAVVISNDSGPLHLANAVGVPTVGIYWCGNLVTAGPVTRLRHRTAISWRLDCPVCGLDCTKHECGHHVSFVAGIPVEEVTAAALEFIHQPALGAD